MSVVVSVEDAGPSRKQLKIEIPAPAVDAELDRVTAEFARQANLPGFRKGKAPRSLVLKRYRPQIEEEVLERLLPRYWHQAQAEASIEPLLPPQVPEVKIEAGQPLQFEATVDVRPEIALGDLEGIVLPEPPVDATDAEVDEAIEELRRRQGDWVAVERSAAQGDLVSLEIVERDAEVPEGEEPPKPDTVSIEIGDPRVWEELSIAVTGLSAGQEGEFRRSSGEGEEAKTRTFSVKVGEVKERELPELDDELAKAIGGFETVDELKSQVAARISHNKEHARLEERERALHERLRDMHPIELPERVVGRELDQMLRDYAEQLVSRGVDLERAEIDWARTRDEMLEPARRRVHSRLILDAIAADRKVLVSEPEFETALSTIARAQRSTTSAVRQALDRSGRLGELRAQLVRDKVVRSFVGSHDHDHDHGHEAPAAPTSDQDDADAEG
ncbi:MAG: trigger factor [Acidobacteria bacterium]|nr:trigger factor [Acidobacteriota bacterium]